MTASACRNKSSNACHHAASSGWRYDGTNGLRVGLDWVRRGLEPGLVVDVLCRKLDEVVDVPANFVARV